MPINCCSDCDAPLYVGGGRRIRIISTDNDGVRTNPTAITVTLTDPSGNEDSYTYAAAQVIRATTGDHYYDPSWDEAGEWLITVAVTGAVHDTWKGTIEVLD